ncbi:MAG: hypothetical protein LJE91_16235, partial [Gammaproteobacteria bacterium]|nr:hypothetical protein [Gammaproteobacteria bacterium]
MDILAIQTVAGPKSLDRFDGPLLQPFTSFEIALAFGELDQESAHQRRNRSLLLRRPDTSASMDFIRHCDCDIFHMHIITGGAEALKRVNHRNRTAGNSMARSSPSDKSVVRPDVPHLPVLMGVRFWHDSQSGVNDNQAPDSARKICAPEILGLLRGVQWDQTRLIA